MYRGQLAPGQRTALRHLARAKRHTLLSFQSQRLSKNVQQKRFIFLCLSELDRNECCQRTKELACAPP